MKTVGITANLAKENALDAAGDLCRRLRRAGFAVFVEEKLAGLLGEEKQRWTPSFGPGPEVLIVLGGDGTLISTFRGLGGGNIPLLGVNLGGLGFLTGIPLEHVPEMVREMKRGTLVRNSLATLDCRCSRGGRELFRSVAVNDAVIGKGGRARVIRMEAFLDGEYLTSYLADGLIVATPTGSTAYSLSAGGPVLGPDVPAFLINPICPHTLTNRPLVVSHRSVFKTRLLTAPAGTSLTIDGQVEAVLEKGDLVEIRRHRRPLILLTLAGNTYYRVLKKKLHWGIVPSARGDED